jgi:isoamylase
MRAYCIVDQWKLSPPMPPTATMPEPRIEATEAPPSAVSPGKPFPQGATWDGTGVNFALFSDAATGVELCLFDHADDKKESARIAVVERTSGTWHIRLDGIKPGQLYGYRVNGPYEPERGLRFNAHKLLLDPYAKAIGRPLRWADELFGYRIGDPAGDLSFDERDSAPFAPLGMVVDEQFDWSDEQRPVIPWHRTIIYEAHVRGLTKLHPDLPAELRGTYAGLASPPVLAHLKKLGVTTVELMPVHHFIHDRHLTDKGLRNYWGYNTLGFFAPEPGYAHRTDHPAAVVQEFKETVKALHNAGFEVILDVVYNHTGEGSELGPTLSFRGIDNLAFYRTVAGNSRYYMDYTGCGNTLNLVHPHSLQVLMDSLRYWVTEMHIDGFRFDLAAALARELHDVNQLGPFFHLIYQDPTLAPIKLIAEPWDLGEGGFQVGKFPTGWAEWNGKFRDDVRRFWKGDSGFCSEIATRLGGSSDLYEHTKRPPSASINFVTAHDGFTLQDLVSFDHKHNEANKDDNRDGTDDNHAWNCGAEGKTDDPGIVELRERQKRNLWCTLLFAQGVPMISGGDELSRTQQGNNNGYCQDSELTWHDWSPDPRRNAFFEFASKVVRFRQAHANFHRRSYWEPDANGDFSAGALQWFRSDGEKMTAEDWTSGWIRVLGMFLPGSAPNIRNDDGERIEDADFLLLVNAHHEPGEFQIPPVLPDGQWTVTLDTNQPALAPGGKKLAAGDKITLGARSLVLLGHER